MAKDSTHVVLNPNGGWSVKLEGTSRALKRFDKQQDAIEYARNISRERGAEFVIHRPDGTVRSKESFARDSNPPS